MELATLVTVVAGPNDTGKTKALEALRIALEEAREHAPRNARAGWRKGQLVHIAAESVARLNTWRNLRATWPVGDILHMRPKNEEHKGPVPEGGAGALRWARIERALNARGKSQTLIIEHADAFLHPMAAAELADAMAAHAKRHQLRIVAETHSEAFVRRLQRRVAEGRYSAAEIRLYATGEASQPPIDVELNDYGEIAHWPQGWFGDDFGEITALTIAGEERRANEGRPSVSASDGDQSLTMPQPSGVST